MLCVKYGRNFSTSSLFNMFLRTLSLRPSDRRTSSYVNANGDSMDGNFSILSFNKKCMLMLLEWVVESNRLSTTLHLKGYRYWIRQYTRYYVNELFLEWKHNHRILLSYIMSKEELLTYKFAYISWWTIQCQKKNYWLISLNRCYDEMYCTKRRNVNSSTFIDFVFLLLLIILYTFILNYFWLFCKTVSKLIFIKWISIRDPAVLDIMIIPRMHTYMKYNIQMSKATYWMPTPTGNY